jgi:hypothetical protein
MCNAWIRQPKQPPWDSKIINELVSQVTDRFDNQNSPLGHQ